VSLIPYLITNFYIGAGIAADVYAATLASFREFEDDKYRFNWVWRNTFTHTLFPFIGLYSVVLGIAVWQHLQPILFTIGALLLGLFLWHLLQGKAKSEAGEPSAHGHCHTHSHSHAEGLMTRLLDPVTRWLVKRDPQWGLVLGVSLDAINSGFAKAADTTSWSKFALLVSFPLVGCVVGLGAWLGGQKAKFFLKLMRNLAGRDTGALAKRLAKLEFVALIVEVFVLGYFFFRSVVSAIVPITRAVWLEWRGYAWGTSFILTAGIFVWLGKVIFRNIERDALHSFQEERKLPQPEVSANVAVAK
jgi:membrane protein implicated in regulation of membrane protease activity